MSFIVIPTGEDANLEPNPANANIKFSAEDLDWPLKETFPKKVLNDRC